MIDSAPLSLAVRGDKTPLEAPGISGSPGRSSDLKYACLCAFATLAVLVLTCPVAECGVNDDWSYSKTALDLAETGRLHYNGWAAAMVGAQAFWGALFIKLFGFSFLVLRVSTAILAAGCAALCYLLHRRAGLPATLSVFGTLTLTLSPVFLPNAVTFMTDVPALFLFLASLYGYARLAEWYGAETEPGDSTALHRRFWLPLIVGFAAGLLGGTVRQVNWILPIIAPVYILLKHRTRLDARAFTLLVSSFAALLGAVLLSAWFHAQPYSIQEQIGTGLRKIFQWKAIIVLLEYGLRFALTLGIMALPVLIALPLAFPAWCRARRKPRTIAGIGVLLSLGLAALIIGFLKGNWAFPWMGNTFTIIHYMDGTAPTPVSTFDRSPILPLPAWNMLSICVITLLCACLVFRMATLPWRALAHPRRLSEPVALLLLFALAYAPLLLLKVVVPNSFGVFDRYLLPLLPLGTLILLTALHRATGRDRMPVAAWVVLIAFAFYGTAAAHDYFAQLRARLDLTGQLLRRGVPRTRIMAGMEYDAWTQVTVAGFYNDTRVKLPPGAVLQKAMPVPFNTVYMQWQLTPAVLPAYVVALGHHPDLVDTDLPAATYDCWLPPFRRELIVQTPDPSLAAIRSRPVLQNGP